MAVESSEGCVIAGTLVRRVGIGGGRVGASGGREGKGRLIKRERDRGKGMDV
jgi:hypothetical protein